MLAADSRKIGFVKATSPRLKAALGALALCCVALSVPHVSAQATDAKPIDDPESYAVYSALLPDRAMLGMRRSMIVVQAESTVSPHLSPDQPPGPCWPSGPPTQTEWKSTLESLRAENAHARTLLPGFASLRLPYVVLSRADINALFSRDVFDGWKQFYDRFPESAGYLQLSAVGFDADRTKAMVYMAHSYSNMGGEYAYYLLTKLGGHWQNARVPGVNVCMMMS